MAKIEIAKNTQNRFFSKKMKNRVGYENRGFKGR